jgi:hypothetical protein
MKNKLIDGSASIFSLKIFTYDLYLYFCFWPATEFIVQSNDFIFTGFILGLRKLILKKSNWKITFNYNKKTYLYKSSTLNYLIIYIYIYIYILQGQLGGARTPACPPSFRPCLSSFFFVTSFTWFLLPCSAWRGVIRNLILFLDFRWFVIIDISCRIYILLRFICFLLYRIC